MLWFCHRLSSLAHSLECRCQEFTFVHCCFPSSYQLGWNKVKFLLNSTAVCHPQCPMYCLGSEDRKWLRIWPYWGEARVSLAWMLHTDLGAPRTGSLNLFCSLLSSLHGFKSHVYIDNFRIYIPYLESGEKGPPSSPDSKSTSSVRYWASFVF